LHVGVHVNSPAVRPATAISTTMMARADVIVELGLSERAVCAPESGESERTAPAAFVPVQSGAESEQPTTDRGSCYSTHSLPAPTHTVANFNISSILV
jgi:hypothetical protein